MCNIDVHVRLRDCCRKQLAEIDKRKKDASFERGLLALPSLHDIFGEVPVDRAREMVPPGSSAGDGSTPAFSRIQETKLKICRTLCKTHAKEHERDIERLEATFWHELGAGLQGELRQGSSATSQPGAAGSATGGTACGTSGMDVQKAVDHITSAAKSSSSGWCSRHVRRAIEAGGVSVTSPTAKDLGPSLESAGFLPIATQADLNTYVPTAGDVVVFDAVTGHDSGHTAMYDGEQWVSDWKQLNFFVDEPYKNGNFTINRP